MTEENTSEDRDGPVDSGSRPHKVAELESVVIRFAGDSGDGIQLTGTEFSRSIASGGHEFVTQPDYPAEIRAPAGTVAGVSGFQINFLLA